MQKSLYNNKKQVLGGNFSCNPHFLHFYETIFLLMEKRRIFQSKHNLELDGNRNSIKHKKRYDMPFVILRRVLVIYWRIGNRLDLFLQPCYCYYY